MKGKNMNIESMSEMKNQMRVRPNDPCHMIADPGPIKGSWSRRGYGEFGFYGNAVKGKGVCQHKLV